MQTAEWAAACTDVAPVMGHKPAAVFSRFPVPRGTQVCQGQKYGAVLLLPDGEMSVSSVSLEWLPHTDGVIRLVGLVFADGPQKEPVGQTEIWTGDASRWREFRRGDAVDIYENLQAMPRAWMVPEALPLTAEQIKTAIQTSRLPGGRTFDPRNTALVEDSAAFSGVPDPQAHARIGEDRNSSLVVQTESRQPAFLVLGDFYFPGWEASINGRPAPITRTNYIQRGVAVPAGTNQVRFVFRPTSLYAGMAVSAMAMLLALLASIFAWRRGSW